jgi:hypothetical protein
MPETGRVTDGATAREEIERPKRVSGTVMDMVRSLGLMLVIVAVTLVFVPGLLHPSKSQRVQSFQYGDYVQGFHQVTGLNAVVPVGLASGWYANSATLTHRHGNATLYIGWVTPTKEYAALYESDQPSIALPTVKRGDRTVRRTIGKLTVVITGSASETELIRLADSLRS